MKRFPTTMTTQLLARLVCMAFTLCLIIGVTPAQSPSSEGPESGLQGRDRTRQIGRENSDREGKLDPGDPAPDFELRKLKSEEQVRLSGFKDRKPVALVFGSYT